MGSDCLFCRIVTRAVPAKVISEDEQVMAFRDINPQAPTHVLIVPKRHLASLADLGDAEGSLLSAAMRMANQLARQEGIAETGYRVVSNCGADAGQSVGHLHWHLLGGRRMTWPPG